MLCAMIDLTKQRKKNKMFASFFYGYKNVYLPRHSAVAHSIKIKVQNKSRSDLSLKKSNIS